MHRLSRRAFIGSVAAAVPALALPCPLSARSAGGRELRLLHTHTSERLVVEYHDGHRYLADALSTVDHFLRDFRTGDVHQIDPQLLDLLHTLAGTTGAHRPFEVISGYRSRATNQMLRRASEGVAAGSLHMQGMAVDVRLTGVPLVTLREAALAARGGGVGFYPRSQFVHIDTGRVRAW